MWTRVHRFILWFRDVILLIMDFRDKKVLVMGLGKLGGGVATARWFVRQSARVTVTDLRKRSELLPSLKALGAAAGKIKFVLGKHRTEDFKTNDLIVVNPAVPRESPYLAAARRAGKDITNDAKVFFDLVRNPIVAVTGTRGKTTTTNWIAHLMGGARRGVSAAGNTPDLPLLAAIDMLKNRKIPAVLELSSWQLELIDRARRGPDVALITNLYRDHQNRYRGMQAYARAKANIFAHQTSRQYLLLNAESDWTPFFLDQEHKGKILFFSTKPLSQNRGGLCIAGGRMVFTSGGNREEVLNRANVATFAAAHGAHNLQNLLAAMLAAHCAGVPWKELARRGGTLPSIPFREEIIISRRYLTVVNDTAATSPDGTIAALNRFVHKNLILITGGTDKKLEFAGWARMVKRRVKPEHLFLLEGSATKKMLRALKVNRYFKNSYPQLFKTLPEAVKAVKQKIRNDAPFVVLFSPGAASFEKFKNEFDRGRKFNLYWKQIQP